MSTPYHDILDLPVSSWGEDHATRIAEHLTFIADIELDDEAYQFHDLRFYVRKADGVVLYATDAGCSCPSPFEDTRVSDLKETSLSRVEEVARENLGNYGRSLPDVLADVRRYIPAMREAGAK